MTGALLYPLNSSSCHFICGDSGSEGRRKGQMISDNMMHTTQNETRSDKRVTKCRFGHSGLLTPAFKTVHNAKVKLCMTC